MHDSAQNDRQILVVDDSAVVRAVVCRRLRAAGLRVVEAESVAGALASTSSNVACALLDLELPDGTGLDIARAFPDPLPRAFFTSASEGALRTEAARRAPCFVKPDELEAAIAWVLAQVSA